MPADRGEQMQIVLGEAIALRSEAWKLVAGGGGVEIQHSHQFVAALHRHAHRLADTGLQDALLAKSLIVRRVGRANALAPAVTVSVWDDIEIAARLFLDKGFRSAPVVDDQDRLVGVISTLDLLRGLPALAKR